jgi:hypothetical protein
LVSSRAFFLTDSVSQSMTAVGFRYLSIALAMIGGTTRDVKGGEGALQTEGSVVVFAGEDLGCCI